MRLIVFTFFILYATLVTGKFRKNPETPKTLPFKGVKYVFKFMKTKKGFTLTELLLVVAVIGIIICVAVPIYNGFTKSARIRNCSAARMKVRAQAESWCKDNFFNSEYSYKIVSDGETVSFTTLDGAPLNEAEANNLRDNIHENDIPYCPSEGAITVVVEPRASGIPRITVTCDGGKDGDCHKLED